MKEREFNDTLLYGILRPIVAFLVFIVFHPRVIGKKNIPKDGAYIFAGNHTSIFDPVMLMGLSRRHVHFFAKVELFRGIQKILFANLGLIFVDRSKTNTNVLGYGAKYLNNGLVVGIFPEGTTEKGRGLLPFKKGACKLANMTDTKIVPFIIKGKYRPFINKISIEFMEPFSVSGDSTKDTNELRKIFEEKMV